jgi:hypothetical protein
VCEDMAKAIVLDEDLRDCEVGRRDSCCCRCCWGSKLPTLALAPFAAPLPAVAQFVGDDNDGEGAIRDVDDGLASDRTLLLVPGRPNKGIESTGFLLRSSSDPSSTRPTAKPSPAKPTIVAVAATYAREIGRLANKNHVVVRRGLGQAEE